MDIPEIFAMTRKLGELVEMWVYNLPNVKTTALASPADMACWPTVFFLRNSCTYELIVEPHRLLLQTTKIDDRSRFVCDILINDVVIEDPTFDPEEFFKPLFVAMLKHERS